MPRDRKFPVKNPLKVYIEFGDNSRIDQLKLTAKLSLEEEGYSYQTFEYNRIDDNKYEFCIYNTDSSGQYMSVYNAMEGTYQILTKDFLKNFYASSNTHYVDLLKIKTELGDVVYHGKQAHDMVEKIKDNIQYNKHKDEIIKNMETLINEVNQGKEGKIILSSSLPAKGGKNNEIN